ncbi:MAG: T9SS type A sorting domain-containing protein [Ignavibacteriae bacterium]|nr:T9SS type A sorting domain-containing protein [Ignavibacteriota bacterium]
MRTFLNYKDTFYLLLFISTFTFAQQDEFVRIDSILVPEIENCGFGEIIAGVDFDGDNLVEIYAVNNMNDLGGEELIPRIYKYEFNGTEWQLVWDEYSRDILQQNSWAPITYGDWDKDNKQEIIWSPVNNFDVGNENPPRILVWEANGDDKLGKANFGFETPSAKWTITDEDNFEVRPFRIILKDIDNDGTEELIFADREANYRFGIVSVSDIPDNGNGSETWELDFSGLDLVLPESSIYDMATINNTIYLFHSDGNVTPVRYEDNNYSVLPSIPGFLPGGSWKSANTVDLDNDGKEEIVIGGWQLDDTNIQNKVFLLQEDETGALTKTRIANFQDLITVDGRINGGHDAFGDIDNDGRLDFIFGSRSTAPAVAILRMEYLGGEIADSNNYEISIVDSLYPTANPGRYDVVSLANLDSDPALEILYTNGNTCERFPIVILDLVGETVDVANDIVPNDFSLEQNYPNPFNPTTKITYTIANSVNVSIILYDMLGRKVKTVVDKNHKPGTYSIDFRAKNNMASGTYIYQIRAGGYTESKKMILLK